MSKKKHTPPPQFDSRMVFSRLLKYLWEHKTLFLLANFFMICTAITEASFAYLVEPIINDGFINAKPWHLKWLAVMVFGIMLFRSVFGFFGNYCMLRLGRHIIFDVRRDVFTNLITLPTSYFDKNSSATTACCAWVVI